MSEPRPPDRLEIVEERLHVDKRTIETDRLQVRTIVEERAVSIEDSIERGTLEVERIAVEREVVSAPPPLEEGDLLVVSVVEERVELVKRLFVVEELRIRRTRTTEPVLLSTTVRSMRAVVDRDDAPATGEN